MHNASEGSVEAAHLLSITPTSETRRTTRRSGAAVSGTSSIIISIVTATVAVVFLRLSSLPALRLPSSNISRRPGGRKRTDGSLRVLPIPTFIVPPFIRRPIYRDETTALLLYLSRMVSTKRVADQRTTSHDLTAVRLQHSDTE